MITWRMHPSTTWHAWLSTSTRSVCGSTSRFVEGAEDELMPERSCQFCRHRLGIPKPPRPPLRPAAVQTVVEVLGGPYDGVLLHVGIIARPPARDGRRRLTVIGGDYTCNRPALRSSEVEPKVEQEEPW
jgi:hypothetical protein